MPSRVGHGFPNDSFHIGDEAGVHERVDRSRPCELDVGSDNRFELFNNRLDATAEPRVGSRVMEVEDRGADLADGCVKFVHGLRQPRPDRRFLSHPSRTLQTEANSEQSLDDVIVEVAGDPVAVFKRDQALPYGPGISQLECDAA